MYIRATALVSNLFGLGNIHSAKCKADKAPGKELIIQYFHDVAFALKKTTTVFPRVATRESLRFYKCVLNLEPQV